ncbi:MAG: class I SAM-dependent methyltransferase [Dehalococcoidia bacterium]
MYVVRSTCRSCGGSDLELVLALGEMPLPDALLLPSQLEEPERRYPLDVAFCRDCALVQLMQTVSLMEMYDGRYGHLSSASAARLAHLRTSAEQLIEQRGLDGNSYVIEIGSNDGSMLRCFQARGVPTLGIEPAPGPASEARRAGIATLPTFFTKDLAGQLAAEGRKADVIIANQVLSRVPDLHGFLAGVRVLLGETGVLVIEVPYVRDLIESGAFDTVNHEQLSYFSLTSLVHLFDGAGLSLNHVERLPECGGSLRLFLARARHVQPSVARLLEEEAAAGVADASYYAGFAWRAELVRSRLIALLESLKASRKRIVGYGAEGMGSTMLNYCGVDENYLDYVVDLNIQKQGRFMPGVHLPVLNPDRLVSNHPDYVLLLAWTARDEVLSQQEAYRRQGGRFIVPLPEPAII